MLQACTEALQCGPELCFDETLYANRGRGFSFKQYMKVGRYLCFLVQNLYIFIPPAHLSLINFFFTGTSVAYIFLYLPNFKTICCL
jgi:hypothetical protein